MKNKLLAPVEKKITVSVKAGMNPSEFFVTRKGLYVGSSFSENVLAKVKESQEKGTFVLSSYTLIESAYDKEIEAELPKKHTFSESELCGVLASLIEKQSKGEDGTLDSKDYNWNIFYTKNFVVALSWYPDGRYWSLLAWGRDCGWYSSLRVFSPAVPSKN